jgi:hypothetical protein
MAASHMNMLVSVWTMPSTRYSEADSFGSKRCCQDTTHP